MNSSFPAELPRKMRATPFFWRSFLIVGVSFFVLATKLALSLNTINYPFHPLRYPLLTAGAMGLWALIWLLFEGRLHSSRDYPLAVRRVTIIIFLVVMLGIIAWIAGYGYLKFALITNGLAYWGAQTAQMFGWPFLAFSAVSFLVVGLLPSLPWLLLAPLLGFAFFLVIIPITAIAGASLIMSLLWIVSSLVKHSSDQKIIIRRVWVGTLIFLGVWLPASIGLSRVLMPPFTPLEQRVSQTCSADKLAEKSERYKPNGQKYDSAQIPGLIHITINKFDLIDKSDSELNEFIKKIGVNDSELVERTKEGAYIQVSPEAAEHAACLLRVSNYIGVVQYTNRDNLIYNECNTRKRLLEDPGEWWDTWTVSAKFCDQYAPGWRTVRQL